MDTDRTECTAAKEMAESQGEEKEICDYVKKLEIIFGI